MQERGEIEVTYIRTELMITDILTKSLPNKKHDRYVRQSELSSASIGGVLEINE